MSKIDMKKTGAHKLTSSVELRYKNDKAESYTQYLDVCGQLVNKYQSDIDFIVRMFSELRQERKKFFQEDLHEIRESLIKADIPTGLTEEWVKEMKKDFDKSFKASERILKCFWLASVDNIKNELKEIIDG